MTMSDADPLLNCYRGETPRDARIARAVRQAEADETLQALLRDQVAFDQQISDAIHSVLPPDDIRKRLSELTAQANLRRPMRTYLLNPAALAVGLGALLIIGIGIFFQLERLQDFPGKETVEGFLSITEKMNGTELEPTSLPAGQLEDSMYLNGFEGFALPPAFTQKPALGWRVLKMEGHRIAQLAIEDHASVLLVFRGADFGVQLPTDNSWRLISGEEWVAAVQEREGLCFMIAFRGSQSEMDQYLKKLK